MIGVLWDLDGTLVDSARDIANAADRMLVRTGRAPIGEARVRGFIGDGARLLVDRCVRAAGGTPSERDVALFMEEYGTAVAVHTTVHPAELRALLPRVRAPMAVVTNKPERLTRALLEHLDLARFFPVVIGGDTLRVRKPDPEPLREALRRLGVEEGVLVGDGPADVGAARAAGMWMIGVGWGIAVPEGADEQVATVGELGEALRRRGVDLGDGAPLHRAERLAEKLRAMGIDPDA